MPGGEVTPLPPHLVQREPRRLPLIREHYPHSVSSLKLGARCEYAWWLQYGMGIYTRELTWDDVERGEKLYPGERSRAFGVRMHEILEHHVQGKATAEDWLSEPGRAAEAISHYLPEDLSGARAENSLGALTPPSADYFYVFDADGRLLLTLNGFVDLLATWTPEDAARTGIAAGSYIVDYKSSSDPHKWALSAEELERDLQACVYRVAARDIHNPAMLWLYAKSRGAPVVYPQRITLKYLPALARVREEIPLARRLEAILAGEVIPTPNTDACNEYGGCPYASGVGGPCEAKPDNKKLFARAIRAGAKSEAKKTITKGKHMAIRGLTSRAAQAAETATLPEDTEAEAIDVEVTEPVEETPAPAPKARHPRPAKASAKKGAPKGALADALEDAQVKLAEVALAEAALEDARANLTAALAAVQKAGA